MDSPRIDLKPNPLYEEDELVLFKTHYYGGKEIPVGGNASCTARCCNHPGWKDYRSIHRGFEGDPVFTITDLLPHLAQKQMEKKMSEGITGEGLNLLVGSMPYSDEDVGEAKAQYT